MYVERQRKKSGTYFYIVTNLRKGGKWKKERIYIGKDLEKAELKRRVALRKPELTKKVTETKKSEDPLMDLVSAEQGGRIIEIKGLYLKRRRDAMMHKNRYENFVTKFTYDTNAIEGSTVTLQETALILFDKVVPEGKTIREINEVQNHRDAFDYMMRYTGDISKVFVLKLHRLLMHNILWKHAGKFRDVQVYVRGATFTPPRPGNVENEFKRLMIWYRANKKRYHPVAVAAYFHHAFESIHPFRDGNGRVGRLLLNFILKKNNLPMVNIQNKRKGRYYEALEAGNKGNLKPFAGLIIEHMEEFEFSV
ncbi:MAG: Fic family protein [Candidatus Aenigmarchaeota archaeon]|nr:Fic family protein [Candidatus Aenigmarchaeota archaeon]